MTSAIAEDIPERMGSPEGQVPEKRRLCSYVQVCTFIVNECMVGSGKGWACSADNLYILFKAKCLTEGERVVSEEIFRMIMETLGFQLIQDPEGLYYYDHVTYKVQGPMKKELDPLKPGEFDLYWDNQFCIHGGTVDHNEARYPDEVQD